jgi:L-lactate dehydrogenase complex protein LldF
VLRRPWLYRILGKAARGILCIAPRSLIYNRWNPWGKQRELPLPPRESFRELNRKRGLPRPPK